MSKDKQVDEQQPVGPLAAEYHFVMRSLTLRDVGKVPGPVPYSSREYGLPYASFDLDWLGAIEVPANPTDPLAELASAVAALAEWLGKVGTGIGRKIMFDIKLDVAGAGVEDVPAVQADQL